MRPDRLLHAAAAVALLAVQAALLWQHLNHASVTTDEFSHLPQALGYVRSGDSNFLISNPPSGPALAALAVRHDPAVRFDFPSVLLPSGEAHDRTFWDWGLAFQEWNRDGYTRSFHRPRMVIAGLTLLLSVLAYVFARLLAGPKAGLFALWLFAFSPDFIAHGSLVTTDATMALAAVFFVFAFLVYSRRRRWWMLPLPGLAVGLMLLAKHSAILLLPLVPLFLWRREDGEEAAPPPSQRAGRLVIELAAVAVCAWVVASLPYHRGVAVEVPHEVEAVWPSENLPALSPVSRLVFDLSAPMPTAWRRALLLLLRDASRPFPMYFLGRVRLEPSFWYYPVAFLLKTPLALIILLLAAKAGALLGGQRRDQVAEAALFWAGLPSAYFYLLLCLTPGKQYGTRLALPGLGLLLIFTAVSVFRLLPALRSWWSPSRAGIMHKKNLIKIAVLLIVALMGWYAVDTLTAAPNLIGYFNETVGGPRLPHRGHQYLADSNLDWGQDWNELAKWQREHGRSTLPLAPFGLVAPGLFGGEYVKVECPLPSGPVAVSANLVLGIDPFGQSPPCLSDLAGLKPDDRVGSSIFIYRLP